MIQTLCFSASHGFIQHFLFLVFKSLLCFLLCFINYLTQIAPLFFFSEAVTQRCFVKKVLLEISQNSQENACGRASFADLRLKKRLWYRCFPVNFVKFLRAPFLTEHLWRLPLFCQICFPWNLWRYGQKKPRQNSLHFLLRLFLGLYVARLFRFNII